MRWVEVYGFENGFCLPFWDEFVCDRCFLPRKGGEVSRKPYMNCTLQHFPRYLSFSLPSVDEEKCGNLTSSRNILHINCPSILIKVSFSIAFFPSHSIIPLNYELVQTEKLNSCSVICPFNHYSQCSRWRQSSEDESLFRLRSYHCSHTFGSPFSCKLSVKILYSRHLLLKVCLYCIFMVYGTTNPHKTKEGEGFLESCLETFHTLPVARVPRHSNV